MQRVRFEGDGRIGELRDGQISRSRHDASHAPATPSVAWRRHPRAGEWARPRRCATSKRAAAPASIRARLAAVETTSSGTAAHAARTARALLVRDRHAPRRFLLLWPSVIRKTRLDRFAALGCWQHSTGGQIGLDFVRFPTIQLVEANGSTIPAIGLGHLDCGRTCARLSSRR